LQQIAEIHKLTLAVYTACAKTYFTAPRKYCENKERYRDTKCQTYPRVFNMGQIRYPADAPTVYITPYSPQYASVTPSAIQ
jgi:hypothetical protein